MTRRRYAALGLTPLATGGSRCSHRCGTGRDCGRWAHWADAHAVQEGPAHRCNQHAQQTAAARAADPAFAAALAEADHPVEFSVVVTGTTWSLTRDGAVVGGGDIGSDGYPTGLERAVLDCTS